jgi:hypothetical protein
MSHKKLAYRQRECAMNNKDLQQDVQIYRWSIGRPLETRGGEMKPKPPKCYRMGAEARVAGCYTWQLHHHDKFHPLTPAEHQPPMHIRPNWPTCNKHTF